MNEKMISITVIEYERLKADAEFLDALRAAGVDNWDGYDSALDILEEKEER